MAEEVSFQIRISAMVEGESKNLTVAELGVLLTGINRALNRAAGADLTPRQGFSPQSHEPLWVQSEVIRIENGSVLLSIVSSVSDFMQENVFKAAFLAGILGNAAWDFSKVLNKEIGRALRRIGSKVVKERPESRPKIEPFFEHSNEDETSLLDKGSVKQPSTYKKTTYSIVFSQKGITKVEVLFSAFNRD